MSDQELPAKVRLNKILNQSDGLKTLTNNGHAHLITGEWTNIQCHLIHVGGYWFLYFKPHSGKALRGITQLGVNINRDDAEYTAVQLCQYMSAEFELHRQRGADEAKKEVRKVLGL